MKFLVIKKVKSVKKKNNPVVVDFARILSG